MRATAQIGELTLRVERDRGEFEFGNQLNLEIFAHVLKSLKSLRLGKILPRDGQLFGYDLRHFRLNSGQVLIRNRGAELNIIVKAVFY